MAIKLQKKADNTNTCLRIYFIKGYLIKNLIKKSFINC